MKKEMEEIPDELNPDLMLNTIASELLIKIAKGEIDIQKDQIEAHLLQKVCGRQAVIFAGAFVAARAEIQVDQPRDRYFIFHDQNTRCVFVDW